MHTVIIGGGAAGMAAAITAAQRGQTVTVLERNRKPLKKLGVTGNGRANLLNTGEPVYFGDAPFAQAVLAHAGLAAVEGFFAALGVPLREEAEGRVYPAALQAAVVVEALLLRARQLGITVLTGARVTALEQSASGFTLRALQTPPEPDARGKNKAAAQGADAPAAQALTLHADRVIVAVGGAAAPAHGTDGTAYGLLTAFGHRVTEIKPALCALLCDKRRLAGLAGQRLRATLTLFAPDGSPLHTADGEALFGEDAVSGIAAMQLARFWVEGATLTLDLTPATGWLTPWQAEMPLGQANLCVGESAPPSAGMPQHGKDLQHTKALQRNHTHLLAGPATFTQPTDADTQYSAAANALRYADDNTIEAHVRRLVTARKDCALGELFTGVFAAPVGKFICREAGLSDLNTPIAQLRNSDVRRLAATVADVRLPVAGTRGFELAQVTAGGVVTADFDPATMRSKLCENLYAAGEVLNVDGDCGGFNLMFAFASGILAGQAADEPTRS